MANAEIAKKNPSALTRVVEGSRSLDRLTLLIGLGVNGSLIALMSCFRHLPIWLSAPLGTLLLTWHGSLQHETIHGHPTRSRLVNELLGSIPWALWMPYGRYRDLHLQHHGDSEAHLTDVQRDPESFFISPGSLDQLGSLRRYVYRAHCTLFGRLLLGPALSCWTFWRGELSRLRNRSARVAPTWWCHGAFVALLLGWLIGVCHISVLTYVGLLTYPSVSLGLVRSFAEHRADKDARRRTRVVEAGWFWRLLFLNNNYHIVHHRHPATPWHQLPSHWQHLQSTMTIPADLVVTGGYWEIARRYFLRPIMEPEHPEPGRVG